MALFPVPRTCTSGTAQRRPANSAAPATQASSTSSLGPRAGGYRWRHDKVHGKRGWRLPLRERRKNTARSQLHAPKQGGGQSPIQRKLGAEVLLEAPPSDSWPLGAPFSDWSQLSEKGSFWLWLRRKDKDPMEKKGA